MTPSQFVLIVELLSPNAGLSRFLSSIDSIRAPGNRTLSDTSCQPPVTCPDPSPNPDFSHGDNWKNSIQTP
jgi:hypothetical protein